MPLRASNKIDPAFSFSSMTDIVFLLLIFFVIVSTMVSPFALPVDLPKGKSVANKEQPKVALRIDDGERILLNGAVVEKAGLESALRTEMSGHAANDAIVFRVAQSVPTGTMAMVLDMAKRNNRRHVLAAAPKAAAPTSATDAVTTASP